MGHERAARRLGIGLLVLAGVCFLLTLGLAFTIFGMIAAALAIAFAGGGIVLLVTPSSPSGYRFNPPPGWPYPPPGWSPPPGWLPDPGWPSPPPDWRFWVSAAQ